MTFAGCCLPWWSPSWHASLTSVIMSGRPVAGRLERVPAVSIRVYLTGRMAVETARGHDRRIVVPRPAGSRLAFAFLALSAQRPVARDVLRERDLWSTTLPTSWDAALKSMVSKLRSLLGRRRSRRRSDRRVSPVAISSDSPSTPGSIWRRAQLLIDYRGRCDAAPAGHTIARGARRPVVTAIARRAFLAGEDLAVDRRLCAATLQLVARPRARDAGRRYGSDAATRPSRSRLASRCRRARAVPGDRATACSCAAQALAGNRGRSDSARTNVARSMFADELGVEPDPETTALRDPLRHRAVAAATPRR